MKGHVRRQASFLDQPIYDALIPPKHFLRRLATIVDWQALAAGLDDCYADDGRPSWPPEQMLKITILQFLHDRSDREIAEDLRLNIGYKFFLGMRVDELGPDNSSICRFRSRLGVERFQGVWNKIVAAARARRLVKDRLHAVDATAVRAAVDTWRWRDAQPRDDDDEPPDAAGSTPPERPLDEQGGKPPADEMSGSGGMVKWLGPCLERSPDPDACFGFKSKTKPFFGYKAHLAADVDSGIVVTLVTTPGNEADGEVLAEVLACGPSPGAVVADKSYDTRDNHALLRVHKTRDYIIRTAGGRKSKAAARAHRKRGVVERANAWLKRWCGGGRARYWGLEKVSMQLVLATMALNLKRMVCLTPAT